METQIKQNKNEKALEELIKKATLKELIDTAYLKSNIEEVLIEKKKKESIPKDYDYIPKDKVETKKENEVKSIENKKEESKKISETYTLTYYNPILKKTEIYKSEQKIFYDSKLEKEIQESIAKKNEKLILNSIAEKEALRKLKAIQEKEVKKEMDKEKQAIKKEAKEKEKIRITLKDAERIEAKRQAYLKEIERQKKLIAYVYRRLGKEELRKLLLLLPPLTRVKAFMILKKHKNIATLKKFLLLELFSLTELEKKLSSLNMKDFAGLIKGALSSIKGILKKL